MKKKIIILGSSGLIGNTLSLELSKKYKVIGLDKIANKKTDFIVDVNDYEESKKKIDLIIKKNRSIHAVIISVYPKVDIKQKKNSLTLSYEQFSKDLNNHLKAYYNINKIFINYFKKKEGGVIVNFGSIYGSYIPRFEVYEGTKMSMPMQYAIAKNSIITMSKFLAKEYLNKKIRINCVSPGGVFDYQNPKFIKKYKKYTANKSMLSKNDLSGVVKFLISDESSKITGQDIVIDDGYTL